MMNQLWEFFLQLVGLAGLLCLLPLLLLGIIGAFLGIIMKIVTPPVKPEAAHFHQAPLDEPKDSTAPEPLDLAAILDWMDDDKVGVPETPLSAVPQVGSWEDNKLFTREAWLGFGRWLVIVGLYATGVGGTMLMSYATSAFLASIIRLPLMIVMGISLTVVGLVAVRQHIVPKFDEFPGVGWLVGTIAGIIVGAWASLAVCLHTTACTEPSLILSAQLVGLMVGLGVFLTLVTLAEWWAVWGDQYRHGNWLAGFLVGGIIAVILALIGIPPRGILFGWTVCVLIATRKHGGSDTYQRRMMGDPLGLLLAGGLIAIIGLGMERTCPSDVVVTLMLRNWLITGAFMGGLSGLLWLYLWQSAPFDGYINRLIRPVRDK